MKLEKVFGNILRNHRKQKGLSQEALASESALDRTYISLLERGLRQPSLSTIFQLSKGLGISAVDLISAVETTINANSAN